MENTALKNAFLIHLYFDFRQINYYSAHDDSSHTTQGGEEQQWWLHYEPLGKRKYGDLKKGKLQVNTLLCIQEENSFKSKNFRVEELINYLYETRDT